MGDNKAFTAAITAFVDKAKANQEAVVRAVGIRILNQLVMMSPVGNPELWEVNQAAVSYNRAVYDKTGDLTKAAGNYTLSLFKVGMKAIYFCNNVPYAYPLEMGHSTQAPGGMVRITAAEFQRFFEEAVREVTK